MADSPESDEALLDQANAYRHTLAPFARVLASKLGRKREGFELLRAAGVVLAVRALSCRCCDSLTPILPCARNAGVRVKRAHVGRG